MDRCNLGALLLIICAWSRERFLPIYIEYSSVFLMSVIGIKCSASSVLHIILGASSSVTLLIKLNSLQLIISKWNCGALFLWQIIENYACLASSKRMANGTLHSEPECHASESYRIIQREHHCVFLSFVFFFLFILPHSFIKLAYFSLIFILSFIFIFFFPFFSLYFTRTFINSSCIISLFIFLFCSYFFLSFVSVLLFVSLSLSFSQNQGLYSCHCSYLLFCL